MLRTFRFVPSTRTLVKSLYLIRDWNQLADSVSPQKVIPTLREFVDIAGLVAGVGMR